MPSVSETVVEAKPGVAGCGRLFTRSGGTSHRCDSLTGLSRYLRHFPNNTPNLDAFGDLGAELLVQPEAAIGQFPSITVRVLWNPRLTTAGITRKPSTLVPSE